MFKRLILIGALVISTIPIFGTNANAQFFDGWGWFGFSSVRGIIDLSKVPPPQSKPSVVIATANNVVVEVACITPGRQGISRGNPFTTEFSGFNAVGNEDITDRKRGKATVLILFPLDEFEVDSNCQNPNWHVIDDSAMVLSFTVGLEWFACTGEDLDGNRDTDPCIDTLNGVDVFTINQTPRGLLDTVSLSCTLDTTTFPRNSTTGKAPTNAVFACSET